MRIMSGHCVSFEVTGNKNATVGSTKFNTIYIHVHVYENLFFSEFRVSLISHQRTAKI